MNNNKPTKYRWSVCALLFFATTINYLDRQVLSLTWKDFISPEFHWTNNDYGTITALFSIFYAVSMLFAGRFVDWMDTKKGFLWAIGIWSIGAILHAFCGIATAGQLTGNWFLNFDKAHTRSFDDLLKEAGEGLVIDELMGQGADLTSGNYSRGAAGYYFKNGKREYAVSEITVAGNLKDMFSNMALIGNDIDRRYKVQTGSIFIPNLTVSGN